MQDRPPLCVDLDGTLIRADLLIESALELIRKRPHLIPLMLVWLLRGKAHLKRRIAERVDLDVGLLPFHPGLVPWLHEQHAAGRELWLCTATDFRLARSVADHLGLFTGVMASDGVTNLSGANKARALVRRFGERGFDYCGNAAPDLEVWRHARGAILVDGAASFVRVVSQRTPVDRVFGPAPCLGPFQVARALRVHQWSKNALIFAPLLAAHRLFDMRALTGSCLAFIAFSLCASAVYLINDMIDLPSDRQHPTKSLRPFASGTLPLGLGLLAAPLLLGLSAGVAAMLPLRFGGVISAYMLMTTTYSLWLKKIPVVDVLVLAGLYTVRLVAGSAAAAIPLSFWMLLFSIFLFLSLAMVKRIAELIQLRNRGDSLAAGRGYLVHDLTLLESLGSSAGYMSILVLSLYINSPEISALYRRPHLIWLLCPLMLFWVSHVWLLTHRGRMHDDPVVFALKDPASLGAAALGAFVMALAT